MSYTTPLQQLNGKSNGLDAQTQYKQNRMEKKYIDPNFWKKS